MRPPSTSINRSRSRAQRLRRGRVEHGRRGQQELGELGGLGQRALQPAVDLVERPHDPRRVGVVRERDHDRLDAEPPAAETDGDDQTEHVGQHEHRRDHHVDPEVAVIPGPDGEPALLGDPGPVLGGLVLLRGEGPHRLHVHQTVGDMPGHPRDRGLPLVDECLPPADQRCDRQPRHRDEPDEHDDEKRVIPPQHHRRERQRNEAGDDVERERVDELLEPRGEAQHPLGERTGEVVVEEGGVLGEQLVHARDVEAFDAPPVGTVQAVQASTPEHLRQQQHRGETDHRGHRRRTLTTGEASRQRTDDQRRQVGRAHASQRRQQEPGHRQPPQPHQLAAVVPQRQQHRAPA
jgi:hypothetical protein